MKMPSTITYDLYKAMFAIDLPTPCKILSYRFTVKEGIGTPCGIVSNCNHCILNQRHDKAFREWAKDEKEFIAKAL